MRIKSVLPILLVISIVFNIVQFAYNQWGIFPYGLKEAVPNEETALKIAEAIWSPIYGERIYNSTPFNAEYNKFKKVWIVYGTLPEDYVGGVPEIWIRKKDGKVILVNHTM